MVDIGQCSVTCRTLEHSIQLYSCQTKDSWHWT